VTAVCPHCHLGQKTDDATECAFCGYVFPKDQTIAMRVADELEEAVRKGLGRDFLVERQLGVGGMSAVYLARELELNRLVAIKVLPFNLSFGQEAADRFQRETKIIASLDHPHIAPIFRVGSAGSFLWYSMKYIRGQSLSDLLQAQPRLELDTCITMLEQVGSALHYAHRRGVVHRDIKPSNVMLDQEGWAYVCDFGVAKAFGAVPLTETGSTLGTPRYMSPEQCFSGKLDGRSDQYALAILTYECLVGQPPFVADSIGEYVHKHTTVPAPRMADARPDLPPAVSDAVARALRKSPDDRFPDIMEFVTALGGRARRHITLEPSASPVASGPHTPTTPTPSLGPLTVPRWRRAPKRLAAFAAGAVGVLAVLVALVQRDTPAPVPAVSPVATAPETVVVRVPAPVDSSPTTSTQLEAIGRRADPAPPRPSPAATPPAVAPGILFISTTPVLGDLYVDGRRVGTSFTPDGLRLSPGRHVIRVVREGYQPYEQEIDIVSGETQRLTRIPLTPITP
jgi:serine/threonine-protein kinase